VEARPHLNQGCAGRFISEADTLRSLGVAHHTALPCPEVTLDGGVETTTPADVP